MSRLVLLPVIGALSACAGPSDSGDDTGGGIIPEVGVLADDLPVLDAFRTDARIDGNWRWSTGEVERRAIVDGALVMETRSVQAEVPYVGEVNNHLRTPVGQRVDRFAATLTVDDYESVDSLVRAWVGMYYQPVADRGSSRNLFGVRTTLQSGFSEKLVYGLSYFQCADATCATTRPLPGLDGEYVWDVGAPLGEPVALDVAYDASTNEFLFSARGQTARLDASQITGFSADDFLYAELRTQATNSQVGDEARLHARFDDVYADDVLYDDFSGSTIDVAKWQRGETVREIDDGALVLEVGYTGGPQTVGLPLRYRQAVREIAAHVTVESYADPEATSAARVGGAWYWDGTAGDGLGEQNGIVYGYATLTATEAGWIVVRCESRDCGQNRVLGEGVISEVALGETHQLYAAFDGTLFTFQVDDQTPVSFSAVAAGSMPWGPAWASAPKGVEVRVPFGHTGPANLRARFDDVRAWPVPEVSIAVGGAAPLVWRTVGADGAGDFDGLSSLVAFGPDPDDATRAILRAKTGDSASESRCDSGCGLLEIGLPFNAASPWLDGQSITGTATFIDPSSGVREDGAATVTFERFDATGVSPSLATFTTTLAAGVSGAFDTTFLPFVGPRPTRGTRPDDPIWLDAGCAEWVFCDFSAPTDRSTWFAVNALPGETRAVRADGGDATIEVRSPEGALLCGQSASASSEALCRTTATSPMYVNVLGLGGASPRVRVPISVDFVDMAPNQDWSGTVPFDEDVWFRVRHDGTGALSAIARPHDATNGGMSLWDVDGWHEFGNGWCCTGEGSVHQIFVADDGSNEEWIQLNSDGAHDVSLEVVPAGSGATPHDPVEHETPLQYNAFNYAYGPEEGLYVTFTPQISGAFEMTLDGMNWTPEQSPVDWTVFTDPDAPVASTVLTSRGRTCPSEWVDSESRYMARCWTLLEKDVPYVALLEEQGGVGDVLAALWVASPWEEQAPLALGEAANTSAPANTSVNHVTLARSDRGYRVDLDIPTSTGGIDGCFTAMGHPSGAENRGSCFGGVTAFNEAWRAPGDVMADVLKVNLWGGSKGFAYKLQVSETGTGRSADSAFEIAAGSPLIRDVVDAQESVFYAITGAGSTASITVRSSNYGGVNRSPVDWIAYTNPADPNGSILRSCSAGAVFGGSETTYNATCSVSSAVPYYLRITERNGVDDVPVEVLAAVN